MLTSPSGNSLASDFCQNAVVFLTNIKDQSQKLYIHHLHIFSGKWYLKITELDFWKDNMNIINSEWLVMIISNHVE